ncbi:oxidoreductase [Trypanosoma conorhini]|uniref:Oxidoreductase n=1 Tax=Trypanosoma conorhini TaxID=83891 RepID=A0A422Q898_9TRYP|nr:oxidoreductase [Trypanosoma conorhini]RNF26198.1 oxidoreductase [Trypanosoma conorhini]
MRRVLLSRNRVDFVATLLRQGRLADLLMLQHFSSQRPQEPSAGNAAEESSGGGDGAKLSVAGGARRALLAKTEAVRARAMTQPCMGWLADAYGAGEWCALSGAQDTVRAVVGASDPARAKLRGTFLALGQAGSSPVSVRLAASRESGEALLLTLPLEQPGERVRSSVVGVGIRAVTLNEAEASVVSDTAAAVDAFAAEQNLLSAAVCSGILGKLEEICALHATHTVRYDGLLVRNPAVQKRLSQLACARFSLEALSSFVATVAVEEPLPLVESVALRMHAKHALSAGIRHAREVIHGTAMLKATPHRSKPERLIDYPYARELFEAELDVIASLGGSCEAASRRYFTPLLAQSEAQVTMGVQSSMAALLVGGGGVSVNLAAPHVNLRVSAVALEEDITTLLQRIQQQEKREDPLFVKAMAQYSAEVFANTAVVYRTTASLTREEDAAPREWLLTQAFCADSRVRRATIIRDWELSMAARRAVGKASDLSGCTTHPVELMNAEPTRKSQAPPKAAAGRATQAASAS